MTLATQVNSERFQETRKVTLIGALANTLLAIVKILVGVFAHSASLLADGVHSISDLMTDAMVYFAAHHARHGPDEEHPYGHGRFETVATLGLGILLALVAAGIIWDALERLYLPQQLLRPEPLALYAAVFSILVNEWLYHYTYRVGQRIKSSMLKANAWHHRSDAVSSIVVLVGISGTLAGLAYLDAVAAILVGLMILKIAWGLGWTAMQELVDSGLEAERIKAIRQNILQISGVRGIHLLRSRRLGDIASVDVHVLVASRLSVSEGHMISVVVEEVLKQKIDEIDDVTVHIDPEDDETAPPCTGLPLREEMIPLLRERWSDLHGMTPQCRYTLHYLSGKIDVDAYLPLDDHVDKASGEQIRQAMVKATANLPEVGQIRLFYSLANQSGAIGA